MSGVILFLPDALIAAAIADRGKAHPWDTIPVARTALIVIDMQNYFVAPSSQGEAETARDIVPAINRLAAALRERGGRVIWIQNTTTNTREAWSVRHELLSPEKAETRLAAMELDAEGFQLWPTLDVRAEDTLDGRKNSIRRSFRGPPILPQHISEVKGSNTCSSPALIPMCAARHRPRMP